MHPHTTNQVSSNPQVVAAVITRGDRVLVCQRPLHKQHGGLWEFPGGKIGRHETREAAIAQELSEELNVSAQHVGEVLLAVNDERSGFEILFFHVAIVGEPIALEHSAIAWCKPSDLLSYDLAPSDRVFATFLAGDA